MNKRSESKEKTRNIILNKTASLLHKKGYQKISSKQIANKCNLSQGSIFLHFKTKENLLNTIILSSIIAFEMDLLELCNPKKNKKIFLKNYLDILIKHEPFLSRTYKDLPYLSDALSKKIYALETSTKNLFFENLRENHEKKFNIVNSFISIDAFLAQIQKYLLDKKIFTSTNSVIKEKRGKILKLYRTLFE